MTESAGITLIYTQVIAATGFTSSNVTIAEWGILNSGKSDHYAIIKPGAANRPPLSFNVRDNEYRTVIEVWQRYKDDGTPLVTLLGHVDNIIARLDPRRKLVDTTGTVRDANVSGMSEVTEQWTKDGGVSWLKREVYLDWIEEESVSYVE